MLHFSRVRFLAAPWAVACQAPCPWDSPGKNTGAGCHFLLQGIFLTQDRTQVSCGLLNWQESSLPLVPPGKPHLGDSNDFYIWSYLGTRFYAKHFSLII